MKILFQNAIEIDLNLIDSPIANLYNKACKHLQHIQIPFVKWDSPYYRTRLSLLDCVNQLEFYGNQLGIEVNQHECLNQSRDYLNHLHKIYEKQYDGNATWLYFHEHIHICEDYNSPMAWSVAIDYREKAGPLVKKITLSDLTNLKIRVKKGDAYIAWSELGKTPYQYWINQEPNDISRICELSKPWIFFRPKLSIALDDIDFLHVFEITKIKIEEFNQWWACWQVDWCEHWGLSDWTMEQMYGVNVVGNVPEVERLSALLAQDIYPVKVRP